MISPELNTAVKAKLISLGYTGIEISPLIAYADSVPPFMTFNEYPSTRSVEQHWLQQSVVMYYVYDDDASRAKDIVKAMDAYLNVGDDVSDISGDITGSRSFRLCWSRLSSGMMVQAIERDGFIGFIRTYEIGYIKV